MTGESDGGDIGRGIVRGSVPRAGRRADRRFEGTWESLRTHQVPVWYDDAKLGIFIHWGLYSVPGWAPRVPDIQQLLVKDGPKRMLRENPYAEWYRNTMQIEGSPTAAAPRPVYGEDYPYDNFVRDLRRRVVRRRPRRLADLCRAPGARYVVLTTKHHDGFALWPSTVAHPVKGAYQARRDLVGDLTAAVRARRMRMGLYYSGGYDWPFNDAVPTDGGRRRAGRAARQRYVDYVTAHLRELIDRYEPSVLWNDIGWPSEPSCRNSSPTTTTRWTTASSTIAGGSPACRAMQRPTRWCGPPAPSSSGLVVDPRAAQAPHLRQPEALRLPHP